MRSVLRTRGRCPIFTTVGRWLLEISRMNQYCYCTASLLIASATVFADATAAQTVKDLAIYEKRCGHCHGTNAKTLAQSTLRMSGKNIVTSDRAIELRTFLNRHGRSTPDEAQPIYSLLRRYLAAKDLYCCKTNLGPSKQELISGWPKQRFKSDRFRRAIPELRFNENRISNQVGSVDHPQYRCHGSVL
jgi:hypothetical protein